MSILYNWYGSHSPRGMGDELYRYYVYDGDRTKHPTPDSRWSKEQGVWAIRSLYPLEGYTEIELAVVREYFKVGY